ncbi:hypothetical protein G9A89_020754 [Geosiphon pyriformis]|nr:hypothetical protein G9A89_020754 [Geosiphon pyriformis]
MCWKFGFGSWVVMGKLHTNIDWFRSSLVWYSDSHMATGFTSRNTAGAYIYFMKALHYWLSVTIHKHLYANSYPSVLCLFCGNIEVFDHVFSYLSDSGAHAQLLNVYAAD